MRPIMVVSSAYTVLDIQIVSSDQLLNVTAICLFFVIFELVPATGFHLIELKLN